MQKIPVGRTIVFAYRFLVTEIGVILGITWLPALLSGVVSYFANDYAFSNADLLESGVPQAGFTNLILSLASLFVTLFASSMVAVAITRHVLGQRFTGVLVYFAAGPTEWRMMGAYIRYTLGTIAMIGLASVVTFAAFSLGGVPMEGATISGPAAALAVLVSLSMFGYAAVTIARMGFLMPAVVLSEENGGLRRTHDLVRGNVLRMFAIIAMLALPVLFLALGGEAVLLRSALGPDFAGQNSQELFERANQAMGDKLLPWTIFTTVVFILGSGLFYSGAAFAYASLVAKDNPPAEPELT